MHNKQINYVIVAVTILTSISFLDLSFLSGTVIKALEAFTICLLVFINVLYVIYGQRDRTRSHFTTYINFLLLSSILSIFAANIWHHQSPVATIWQQRYLLLYVFYFTLKNFNIDYEFFEKIVYTLGIGVAFLY